MLLQQLLVTALTSVSALSITNASPSLSIATIYRTTQNGVTRYANTCVCPATSGSAVNNAGTAAAVGAQNAQGSSNAPVVNNNQGTANSGSGTAPASGNTSPGQAGIGAVNNGIPGVYTTTVTYVTVVSSYLPVTTTFYTTITVGGRTTVQPVTVTTTATQLVTSTVTSTATVTTTASGGADVGPRYGNSSTSATGSATSSMTMLMPTDMSSSSASISDVTSSSSSVASSSSTMGSGGAGIGGHGLSLTSTVTSSALSSDTSSSSASVSSSASEVIFMTTSSASAAAESASSSSSAFIMTTPDQGSTSSSASSSSSVFNPTSSPSSSSTSSTLSNLLDDTTTSFVPTSTDSSSSSTFSTSSFSSTTTSPVCTPTGIVTVPQGTSTLYFSVQQADDGYAVYVSDVASDSSEFIADPNSGYLTYSSEFGTSCLAGSNLNLDVSLVDCATCGEAGELQVFCLQYDPATANVAVPSFALTADSGNLSEDGMPQLALDPDTGDNDTFIATLIPDAGSCSTTGSSSSSSSSTSSFSSSSTTTTTTSVCTPTGLVEAPSGPNTLYFSVQGSEQSVYLSYSATDGTELTYDPDTGYLIHQTDGGMTCLAGTQSSQDVSGTYCGSCGATNGGSVPVVFCLQYDPSTGDVTAPGYSLISDSTMPSDSGLAHLALISGEGNANALYANLIPDAGSCSTTGSSSSSSSSISSFSSSSTTTTTTMPACTPVGTAAAPSGTTTVYFHVESSGGYDGVYLSESPSDGTDLSAQPDTGYLYFSDLTGPTCLGGDGDDSDVLPVDCSTCGQQSGGNTVNCLQYDFSTGYVSVPDFSLIADPENENENGLLALAILAGANGNALYANLILDAGSCGVQCSPDGAVVGSEGSATYYIAMGLGDLKVLTDQSSASTFYYNQTTQYLVTDNNAVDAQCYVVNTADAQITNQVIYTGDCDQCSDPTSGDSCLIYEEGGILVTGGLATYEFTTGNGDYYVAAGSTAQSAQNLGLSFVQDSSRCVTASSSATDVP